MSACETILKLSCIFCITLVTLDVVNAQLVDGVLKVVSLLASVNDTSVATASIIPRLERLLENQQNILNQAGQAAITQSKTLSKMQETQLQMANTFNEVANIVQIQSKQLQNMTTAMNDIVSLLDKQQNTLEDISRSLSIAQKEYGNTPAPEATEEPALSPRDCSDLPQGNYPSGIYTITPRDGLSFDVYCNMEEDGGGWTVFQRRFDGSLDFYRNWGNYAQGFGDLNEEFWVGLDKISLLTNTAGTTWEMMILLEDFHNETAYARYESFSVSSAASDYALTIGTYTGTAGDSITTSLSFYSQRFTTFDKDNDAEAYSNCARDRRGAWWYHACTNANLNGLYIGPTGNREPTGMFWFHWKATQSLKASTMMIRPSFI